MKKGFLEQSILGTMLEENDQDFSAIFTSKTSRSLKQMAKEFNCHIVAAKPQRRSARQQAPMTQPTTVYLLLMDMVKEEENFGAYCIYLALKKSRRCTKATRTALR